MVTAGGGRNIPILKVAKEITCNRRSVTIQSTPVTGQKSVDSLQLEMALNVIDPNIDENPVPFSPGSWRKGFVFVLLRHQTNETETSWVLTSERSITRDYMALV